ncbi:MULTISPECIES: hypothetical protein [Mycobacteriaceae]|uniref:hypothetical protein n=1 Tax=Mycobacteriaceae TaxID=1762 RepID=UPI0002682643|nr:MULTISPECIES: hypothetical protein [Mycobacteriaceae]EIU51673.1 hypothetical protein MA6G0125S_5409 [Mycobacteroides abscessus 6G-0125-S]EIU64207.1 hypothetical protein MA6G0728S_5324 [Mycobacteroides abscessus 6G-0728-S]EIU74764.1 hypothetical protein MA6G1108_5412 [Mycobacteroides abscessus 6G-1108]EIV03073.1 hypothetical protein MA6G0728R_5353 [Mycobacteroides abscessus 6G-0728-R]
MTPIELLTNAYTRVFPFTTATIGAFFFTGIAMVITVRILCPVPLTTRLRTTTVAVVLTTACALVVIGGIGVALRMPTGPDICMCSRGVNSTWYR